MLTKRERHSFFFFRQHLSLKFKKIHPTFIFGCKKGCKSRNYLIYTLCCGEGGIRTPGTLVTPNGFQDRRLRPLCHLSKKELENFSRFTSTSFLLYITGEYIRLSINSSLYLTKIMSFQQTLPLHLSFHLSYTSQVQT